MTPAEWARVVRRVQSLQFEMQAMRLQVTASMLRATNAFEEFGDAVRESERRIEADALYLHPDLMELDMDDAAWRGES